MTSLRQLEIFVKVADLGSFTQAASELFITQPAISWQIKSLEEQAGVPLFRRRDKKLELSEAGEDLLAASREILTIYRRAEHEMAQHRGLEKGSFHIGASTIPGEYVLPRLLPAFQQEHPQISIRISIGATGEMLRRLTTGELDIAIVGAALDLPDVDYTPWMEDALVGVASPNLAMPELTSLSQLTKLPLIERQEDSGSRMALAEALSREGLSLDDFQQRTVLDSNQAVLTGAIAGLGIAFISMWAAVPALARQELKLLPVTPFPWKRRFYIAQWRPLAQSPLLTSFRDFLLAQHLDLEP